MARTLYELVGIEDRRFSPFCWRARMALAHKGLEAEYEPCGFTEKEKLAFSGSTTIPVLVDGDETIADSWVIADYLETAYPMGPTLFGGSAGQHLAEFVGHWVDSALHTVVFRIVIGDLFACARPEDQAYFRETREKRMGISIEEAAGQRESWAKRLPSTLAPLKSQLAGRDFLAGSAPTYSDYIVFGAFQWARCVSDYPLLKGQDEIAAWRDRMLDLHDGHARSVPAMEEAA